MTPRLNEDVSKWFKELINKTSESVSLNSNDCSYSPADDGKLSVVTSWQKKRCPMFSYLLFDALNYPFQLQLRLTLSFRPRLVSGATSPWPTLSKASHHISLPSSWRLVLTQHPSVHTCTHLQWHHGTINSVSRYAPGCDLPIKPEVPEVRFCSTTSLNAKKKV